MQRSKERWRELMELIDSNEASRESHCILTEDGPWTREARLSRAFHRPITPITKEPPPDDPATKLGRSAQWAADRERLNETCLMDEIEIKNNTSVKVTGIMMRPPVVNEGTARRDDAEMDADLERFFVNHPAFLEPNVHRPLSMVKWLGLDWEDNARGIYYRHYYAPDWMENGQKLWIPSIPETSWQQSSEAERCARAEVLLRHVLDNLQWNKSEFAWDADAWSDVFGKMRDDPLITGNKHDYYTMQKSTHPTWCTLTGEEKFIHRIPDATFGLATHNGDAMLAANGDVEKLSAEDLHDLPLDRENLDRLLLNRNCSLISDPKRTESNLVFPFAVYEAKALTGDPREARRQACAAGAAYLDILDDLVREPEKKGNRPSPFQSSESRNFQVFALTSYGPHWHVMVGYKRERLWWEHAGTPGMSEYVYVFHRIWSARVVTKQKAWELLTLVDQISEWGRSDFRDMVLRHLEPWIDRCDYCFAFDAGRFAANKSREELKEWLDNEMPLPGWVRLLESDKYEKLKLPAKVFTMILYSAWKDGTIPCFFDVILVCQEGDCGHSLGYPMFGPTQAYQHDYTNHGGVLGEKSMKYWEDMFKGLSGITILQNRPPRVTTP